MRQLVALQQAPRVQLLPQLLVLHLELEALPQRAEEVHLLLLWPWTRLWSLVLRRLLVLRQLLVQRQLLVLRQLLVVRQLLVL